MSDRTGQQQVKRQQGRQTKGGQTKGGQTKSRPKAACLRSPEGDQLSRRRMERAKGFEPSTPTLARLCSTPELHPHPWVSASAFNAASTGGSMPQTNRHGKRQRQVFCRPAPSPRATNSRAPAPNAPTRPPQPVAKKRPARSRGSSAGLLRFETRVPRGAGGWGLTKPASPKDIQTDAHSCRLAVGRNQGVGAAKRRSFARRVQPFAPAPCARPARRR